MGAKAWHNGVMKAQELLKALARNERDERLADLRDGRRRVAGSVPSGKTYKRGVKHRGKGYE